jgi:hypothetical protein
MAVDRVYAYEPPLDRRYFGFCAPHALELDFADQLATLPEGARVFLFVNGYIEFPFSQTVLAASQSHIGWQPICVDRQDHSGEWARVVPDAGAPGGMGRTMTIELTGKLPAGTRKLRLTTNLEISYDQIFIARDVGTNGITVRSLPLTQALLQRVGFAREYSPDGHKPLIYDYHLNDATAPFHVLKGAYTRYGPVESLLACFDDKFAILGPGDEIALRFSADSLPLLKAGTTRSFILVSHAYCKDMDLYTATPRTLEPLPFRGMTNYPFAPGEAYPRTRGNQAYLREFNTRIVN